MALFYNLILGRMMGFAELSHMLFCSLNMPDVPGDTLPASSITTVFLTGQRTENGAEQASPPSELKSLL